LRVQPVSPLAPFGGQLRPECWNREGAPAGGVMAFDPKLRDGRRSSGIQEEAERYGRGSWKQEDKVTRQGQKSGSG
jgi:hypothetical protein